MKLKKLFSDFDLTWKKLIILALLAGVYTAVMALIPIAEDTSFSDLTVTFEVWILFGIFIIMKSNSAKESALKCFVFFLISQPLVYLIQVPFSDMGWGLFGYYKRWFIWTLLTIPMGFVGYFMKKNKWWGLAILTPVMVLLGVHYGDYLKKTIYMLPHHLLTTVFCFVTLLIYPICIFKNKKLKIAGAAINIAIIIVMTVLSVSNRIVYNTDILASGGSTGFVFDDSYTAYLEDSEFGTVTIKCDGEGAAHYVNGIFKKGGKTELIMEDSAGNKTVFDLNINYSKFSISMK